MSGPSLYHCSLRSVRISHLTARRHPASLTVRNPALLRTSIPVIHDSRRLSARSSLALRRHLAALGVRLPGRAPGLSWILPQPGILLFGRAPPGLALRNALALRLPGNSLPGRLTFLTPRLSDRSPGLVLTWIRLISLTIDRSSCLTSLILRLSDHSPGLTLIRIRLISLAIDRSLYLTVLSVYGLLHLTAF